MMRFGGLIPFILAEGDRKRSWVQVFRYGEYKHPDGQFTVSPVECENMVKIFNEGKRPVPPTRMAVDYDHLSTGHRISAGPAPRAGDVIQLEHRTKEKEGYRNGLWAFVEWTEQAATYIKNKEYNYTSAVYKPDYVDKETGKALGPTLLNVALVNVPWIEGMEPVTLGTEETAAGECSTLAFCLSEALKGTMLALPVKPNGSLSEPKGGEKRMEAVLKMLKEKYELSDDVLKDEAKLTLALTEAFEKEELADGVIAAKVKELTDQVKVLSEKGGDSAALNARILTLEKQLSEVQERSKTDEAKSAVAKAMSEGRIVPAQEASALKFALSDSQGFTAFVAGLPVVDRGKVKGSGKGEGVPEKSASEEIDEKVEKVLSENKGMNRRVALEQVLKASPELGARYLAEVKPMGEKAL